MGRSSGGNEKSERVKRGKRDSTSPVHVLSAEEHCQHLMLSFSHHHHVAFAGVTRRDRWHVCVTVAVEYGRYAMVPCVNGDCESCDLFDLSWPVPQPTHLCHSFISSVNVIMAANGHRSTNSVSQTQNYKAQLASAYNELGKELSSQKIRVVGNYTLGRVIGEGTPSHDSRMISHIYIIHTRHLWQSSTGHTPSYGQQSRYQADPQSHVFVLDEGDTSPSATAPP